MPDTLQAYFDDLAQQGLAQITTNPLKGPAFIDVTIEGINFRGMVGMFGPYIELKTGWSGHCELGVCCINRCVRSFTDKDQTWHVAKYRDQGRIDISMLSDAGRRALAYEFGLVIAGNSAPLLEAAAFFASKAFLALQEWAKAHPRKIKTFEPNAYLGDWAGAAVHGATYAS